jgi:outer membrane protein OmpA-like peptidoglycan-associated protein
MRFPSITFFTLLILCSVLQAQSNLQGIWQGILVKDGTSMENGTVVYADFKITNEIVTGKIRNEIIGSEYFAVKQIKGTHINQELKFEETVIEKKKSSPQMNWCTIEVSLNYSDSTGYLEGRFKSKTCRNYIGKLILFRSNATFTSTEGVLLAHAWLKTFFSNYKKGYFAPEILDKERNSFVFTPIYFEYNQWDIKPEFYPYLDKIIRVVDSHSDLRIQVTGNTDADGSSTYNDDLSKKRAQALIDYFTSHGMNKVKIVIDFKGEYNPVDSNSTPEGRQKNRRVDIRFI